MLRDSNDSGNDGGLVNGYTMEDVDEDTLNAYRIDYDTLSAPDRYDIGCFCSTESAKIGLMKKERQGRHIFYTLVEK